MKCEEAQELITGLVDNELGAAERVLIETHLKECPNCQLSYRNEMALKQQIRSAAASVTMPAHLRERLVVLSGQGSSEPKSERGGWIPMGWLAFPRLRIAFVAAALILLVPLLYFQGAEQGISRSALETHQKIVEGQMVLVSSDDPAELNQQMIRAVGGRFAPMGYDLSMMKLQPAGGLVQEVGDRKVLITLYRGETAEVTCFTFLGTEKDAPIDADVFLDEEKSMNFYTFAYGGVNAVLHREGELICILVSRMPMPDLLAMARAKAKPA